MQVVTGSADDRLSLPWAILENVQLMKFWNAFSGWQVGGRVDLCSCRASGGFTTQCTQFSKNHVSDCMWLAWSLAAACSGCNGEMNGRLLLQDN